MAQRFGAILFVLAALLALISLALMPAPNADPVFINLDGARFRDPEGPLFADLEGILAAVRGDEGAPEKVNARVLNVVTQRGAAAMLEEMLDEKSRMSLATALALGRDPDLLLLRHQFYVRVGLLPNKQPLCPCNEEYPKEMRPVNLGTRGGTAKQMQVALGVRGSKAAAAAKAKRTKELKSLVAQAAKLSQRASKARTAARRAQYAEQAAALNAQATAGLDALAEDIRQDAPAAGGVVEIAPGPEPATLYGCAKRVKASTVFK
jgi:ribosomal protein L32